MHYCRLRLLVTYVGPGSEIAPERGPNRSALGRGVENVEDANRALLSPRRPATPLAFRRLVALERARYGSGLAAVHRAPRIAGTGTIRLLFKMTLE